MSSCLRWVSIALTLLSLWAWAAGSACAQSSDELAARGLFDEGSSAYAEGNYEHALASFQRSYELSRKPVLLYNVGMVLDRLRRDEEAIAAYQRYLNELPTAENRAAVERRVLLLRQSLERTGTARVATPEDAARSELARPGPLASQPRSDRDAPRFYRRWWFWTSLAVVSAAVVTGVVVANTHSGGSTTREGVISL